MQWLGSCGPRQLCHPQAPEGARLARPPSARHLPLHPDLVFLGQRGRRVGRQTHPVTAQTRRLHLDRPSPSRPRRSSTHAANAQHHPPLGSASKRADARDRRGVVLRRLNTEDGAADYGDLVRHQGTDPLCGAAQGLCARRSSRCWGCPPRIFGSRRVPVRALPL
jgi:hypothetical protein